MPANKTNVPALDLRAIRQAATKQGFGSIAHAPAAHDGDVEITLGAYKGDDIDKAVRAVMQLKAPARLLVRRFAGIDGETVVCTVCGAGAISEAPAAPEKPQPEGGK